MESKSSNRAKVLVVDDAPSNVKMLTGILRDRHDIIPAYSGEEALKLVQAHKPDLILLDVTMPGISGFEVCAKIKNMPILCDIPIIFVTARDEVEDETRGFQLGAVDYLVKPVRKPIVRARVHNHLELKRHRDFLEKLSTMDGLTGIPNRRHFDRFFDQEWRRCVRVGAPISLLLIDIDCFKKFNDRYGHLEGDDCLKDVARELSATPRRPTDFVARYGGEEFAAVLPETDLQGALMLGNSMRAAVEGLAIEHEENASCSIVTVSIGLAAVKPSLGQSPSHLIKLADSILYKAKSSGRNCVHGAWYQPEDPK